MDDSSNVFSEAKRHFKRVAILFAGGPAPSANSVISNAAVPFLRHGTEVLGIRYGYSKLNDYSPETPLVEGEDYFNVTHALLRRSRSSQGIMIGTARTNPGRFVSHPDHLDDRERSAPLRRVYDGLRALGVEALISIGGDDTLKTANKISMFQERLPADRPRIPVIHLPKTIDNDYYGIDFTFGFFTAVNTIGEEIRNLLYDGDASRAYFVAETMGRSAGWLAYGAAIAGEASLVLSVEDIHGENETVETTVNPLSGKEESRNIMDIERVIGRIVEMMLAREKEGKQYGVIVLAEGLAEFLPASFLAGVPRDDHGHIAIGDINLGRMFAAKISEAYHKATGRNRKVTGVQLGYEARCAKPHAFDVLLGSQLGVGAYRALVEKGLDSVLVSVSGQLQLHYVPFSKLVDQDTLITKVRHIERGSDFHRLARFLETYADRSDDQDI